MEKAKETSKNNAERLVKILYVISAVIAVIFVYMVIVNVLYINDYVASYGMSFSDMWAEAVQYVIAGSLSYFVYAVLVFSAGKIISKLSACCCAPQLQAEESCCGENVGEIEEISETADEVSAEGFDPDKVISRLNKNETVEEQPEAEMEEAPEEKPEPVKQRRKRRYMK